MHLKQFSELVNSVRKRMGATQKDLPLGVMTIHISGF
jgi:hypothetical protein